MNYKGKSVVLGAVLFINPVVNAKSNESFSDAVKNAPGRYHQLNPADINTLALEVNDWVIHYEKAVILGTSYEYEDTVKARIFNNILNNENQCKKDINLTTCAKDLICDDKIFTNFVNYWKNINC